MILKNNHIFDLNVWFEKLHRYVYDYCYQNNNADWGAYTAYKKANANNPYRRYNNLIASIYTVLCPFFDGWRNKLIHKYPYVRKYRRYGLDVSYL